MTNSVLGDHKLLFRKGPRILTRINPIAAVLQGFEKKADMKPMFKSVKDLVSGVPAKVRSSMGTVKSTAGNLGASGKGAQEGFAQATSMAGSGDKIKDKVPWSKAKTYAGLGAATLGLGAIASHKAYGAIDRKIGTPAPTQEW